MKAARITGFASQSEIVIDEARPAPLRKHHVLIDIHYASVNPIDWKMQSVLSFIPRNLFTPVILGRDFAGVIAKVGPGVTGFQAGDAVFGDSMNMLKGTFAEQATVHVKQLAKVPGNMTLRDAAALPTAGLIVLQSLRKAHLKAGERILVVGASGGVGTFAVQIAKAMGAQVTGICSGRNVELVRSLGADQVVDYTQPGYFDQIGPIDVVLDTTGAYPLQQWDTVLPQDGRYVSIAPDGKTVLALIQNRLLQRGPDAFFHSARPNPADLAELARLVEQGQLKPVIDSEYPLADINAAFERSRTKRAQGKILIAMKGSV